MHPSYSDWLARAVPTGSTARTKLSELRRIESVYGDIDALYDHDELANVIDDLSYSSADARENRPNPSKLQIVGDIRNNLASYKSAVTRYVRFRQEVEVERASPALHDVTLSAGTLLTAETELERTFSMEKDLQAALRAHIEQLEPGLTIIDGGTEKSVVSGRIDILAKDKDGVTVVIELKAVRAPRDAVAQVLAYMGDIIGEKGEAVRGMLVAPGFDAKAVSATSVVPTLSLHRYAFTFAFERLG